ncbi:LysR family transcriptional regulator [Clostridium sp. E02]|uniref:LysR family transcriptional regulator n=1 Tax=Clostridium sp. E02 TaxID=2487134 RepID=UPI000F52FCD0|nr:LysR family transcriptional regulator [Clostridium sp. E02]
MEIKQLEYFVTTADHGSLNKAAEHLYTSQPNVSKVIANLEKELGVLLFERSSRGIRMTEQGNMLYGHAHTILTNANLIQSLVQKKQDNQFLVSGYQSSILAKLMADVYKTYRDKDIKFGFREGTVEEITDDVSEHTSEIGIVYLAKTQLSCFHHIIWHKKLEFVPLSDLGICVYLGCHHPWFHREWIELSELPQLKFMEGTRDFFAMEQHIRKVIVAAKEVGPLNYVVSSNSDYLVNSMLKHTDVCCMGIDFVSKEYEAQKIRALKVRDTESFLSLGYVKQKKKEMSQEACIYIEELKKQITAYHDLL